MRRSKWSDYFFIALKESSDDYCKGCHMASYSSDFVMENRCSEEKLIEFFSKYLQKNMKLRVNESGYDFFIFKNGYKIFDANTTCFDGDKDEYEEIILEIERIYEKAKNLAEEKQKIYEEQKRQKIIADQAKCFAEEKARKKRVFEKLKKEFEKEDS